MSDNRLHQILIEKSIRDTLKLDLGLIPNGVVDQIEDGQKKSALKFSVVMTLVNSGKKAIPIDRELIREMGIFIHDVMEGPMLKLFLRNKDLNEEKWYTEIDFILEKDQFNPFMVGADGTEIPEEQNGWASILDPASEKIIKLLPFKEIQDEIEPNVINDQIRYIDEVKPAFKPYTVTTEDDLNNYGPLEFLDRLDEKTIHQNLVSIEKELSKIHESSNKEFHVTRKERIGKLDFEFSQREQLPGFWIDYKDDKVIDLNDIMAKIFEHPHMAKTRYGLVFDILVPIKNIPPSAFNSNILSTHFAFKVGELVLQDLLYPPNENNFEPFSLGTISYSIGSETEGTYIIKRKNIIASSGESKFKYYHGREHFGLIPNHIFDKRLTWKNRSRLASMNTKHTSITNAKGKEGYFQRISQKDPNYTRSIIARHDLDANVFNEYFRKYGIIGHNIVVRKSRNKEMDFKKEGSLNIHRAIYELPKGQQASIEVEGYVKFDAVHTIPEDQNHDSEMELATKDLWSWSGKNLSVSNFAAIEDPEDNEDSLAEDAQFINNEEFDLFFKKYGFQHAVAEFPSSNISLTQGHYYSFIIRGVSACNGYVFPNRSDQETELSLEDLTDSETSEYFLNYQQSIYKPIEASEDGSEPQSFELLLAKNPLQSPTIIGIKQYEDLKDPDAQNANSILLHEDGNEEQKESSLRYLYPPISSMQFYGLSGLLERNGRALQVFKNDIKDKLIRSFRRIPSIHQKGTTVRYLPDPRLKYILIAANDWKTRDKCFEGLPVIVGDISELKNKPYTIETRASNLEAVTYSIGEDVINIHLPKRTEGTFRIHALAGPPIDFLTNQPMQNYKDLASLTKLRYESPFMILDMTHAKPSPLTPVLIDPTDRIWVKRFKPATKYEKYIFADLKVNIDTSRKELSMVTVSDQIIDLGTNAPNLTDYQKDKTYFEGEYSGDVFKQRIGNLDDHVEHEMFPNDFGLQLNLPYAGLNMLRVGDEICRLRINATYSVKVVLDKKVVHGKETPIPDLLPQEPTPWIPRGPRPWTPPWIDPRVIEFQPIDIGRIPNELLRKAKRESTLESRWGIKTSKTVYDFSVVLTNNSNGIESVLFRKKHVLTDSDVPNPLGDIDWEIVRGNICRIHNGRICPSPGTLQPSRLHEYIDMQPCSFFFHYDHAPQGPVLEIWYNEFMDNENKARLTEPFRYIKCKLEDGKTNFFDIIGVPDTNIAEENISLNPDVEEFLLYNDVSYDFGIRHYNSVQTNEWIIDKTNQNYFILRNEGDTKFKEKHFLLRARSRFESKFPNYEPDQFIAVSDKTKPYVLVIPNAAKPDKPKITLTPVLHQFELGSEQKWESKQFYRLMIEVDRPWSEDMLALVIEKVEDVTVSELSNIGIDYTKKPGNQGNSIDELKDNLRVSQYIIQEPGVNSRYFGEQSYLKKYLGDIRTIEMDGTAFRVLPLKLTYLETKDKWIAVLGFHRFNAVEDPFLKLVFARYQQYSETRVDQGIRNQPHCLSELTSPLFVHTLSDRYVSVKKVGENTIDIEVGNRLDRKAMSANIFVAGVLKKSLDKQGNQLFVPNDFDLQWYILSDRGKQNSTNEKNLIPYVEDDRSLLICEIQQSDSFDTKSIKNLIEEKKIDVLNDQRLKIIFMKEVELDDLR